MLSKLEYISIVAIVLLFVYVALEVYWIVFKDKMLSFQVVVTPVLKSFGLTVLAAIVLRMVGIALSLTGMIFLGYKYRLATLNNGVRVD